LPDETLPIICGGTHYFIQHFLFPPSELSTSRHPFDEDTGKGSFDPLNIRWKPPCPRPPVRDDLEPELNELLDSFWTAEPVWPGNHAGPSAKSSRPVPTEPHQLLSSYKLLEAVDPAEAGRWHWRDGRKVRRGLERWWERGGGPVKGGGEDGEKYKGSGRQAKFRTLIFWVYEPLEMLRPRLERRVGNMVEVGIAQLRLTLF